MNADPQPSPASARNEERRLNALLAQYVDLGIEKYRAGNWSAARELFAKHQVPATVAVRVLFHQAQRRQGR